MSEPTVLEKVTEVLCNEAIKQHGGIVERKYSAMSSSGKAKWRILARAAITTLAANVDDGMVFVYDKALDKTWRDKKGAIAAAILKAGE